MRSHLTKQVLRSKGGRGRFRRWLSLWSPCWVAWRPTFCYVTQWLGRRAQQITSAGQPSSVIKHQDRGKTPSQEVKVESKWERTPGINLRPPHSHKPTRRHVCQKQANKTEKNGVRCSNGLRMEGYVAPLDKMSLVLGKGKQKLCAIRRCSLLNSLRMWKRMLLTASLKPLLKKAETSASSWTHVLFHNRGNCQPKGNGKMHQLRKISGTGCPAQPATWLFTVQAEDLSFSP